MLTEDQLISQLVVHTKIYHPHISSERLAQHPLPPATPEEIKQVEIKMGMQLPPLLKRLYMEVGNGKWGPGYGLYPLQKLDGKSNSIVQTYQDLCTMTQADIDQMFDELEDSDKDKPFLWPKQCIQLVDWGCNMYSTIDISLPSCPIYFQDHNKYYSKWAIEADSLHEWLEAWLAGALTSNINFSAARLISF